MKKLPIYLAQPNDQPLVEAALQPLGLLPYVHCTATLPATPNRYVHIADEQIRLSLDWLNEQPPFLLPTTLAVTTANVRTLVLYALGLEEDAFNCSEEALRAIFEQLSQPTTSLDWLKTYYEDHPLKHNEAILTYYFGSGEVPATPLFEAAIASAATPVAMAYSIWHYAIALQDEGRPQLALAWLQHALTLTPLPEAALHALKWELIKVQNQLLGEVPEISLGLLKQTIAEVTAYYTTQANAVKQAGLLQEKAKVASWETHFSEALGYLNQAIALYEQEGLTELKAEASLQKGNLLCQWAQQEAPQFYPQAIQAFQMALTVFKKEVAPFQFAEIHHQLAVIYTEMPADPQKKGIWAAVAASSFQEALAFFNKADFPLDYAAICHNYGTALMKFPEAALTDHTESAIHYFMEALEIRTAEYPQERCISILNYLEACWEVNNINQAMERVRLKDMLAKVREVPELTDNTSLLEMAQQHLEKIKALQQMALT